MNFEEAKEKIQKAISNKHICIVIGECEVLYEGRASSKLPKGKRLVIIKADDSISVHENRLIRPTNYMLGAKISCNIESDKLILYSAKIKPKEKIRADFYNIDDIKSYEMEISNDLRLSGSEKELNDALMEDLSFLETGLRPINQQQAFKKGICDIVAEDAQGRLVVIELKRRQADFAAVTQLKRYSEQVSKLKGIKTRGILLAPDIRKNALDLLKSYGLEYFSYDFEVGERSKIKGIQKTQKKIFDYEDELH